MDLVTGGSFDLLVKREAMLAKEKRLIYNESRVAEMGYFASRVFEIVIIKEEQ